MKTETTCFSFIDFYIISTHYNVLIIINTFLEEKHCNWQHIQGLDSCVSERKSVETQNYEIKVSIKF